jgi:DNA-binding NtrC family response regulator
LNILPLQTIPLRRRREDIEYLLKHFININLHHRKIETLEEFFKEETIEFLNNYEWIGNVRELINLVEYLTLIYNGERLGISSLHGYMMDVESKRERVYLSKDEVWILRQFEIYDNISLGRTRLAELAIDEGVKIGEGKIRGILKSLEKYGFIQSLGNMGSRITEDGRKFLGEL